MTGLFILIEQNFVKYRQIMLLAIFRSTYYYRRLTLLTSYWHTYKMEIYFDFL
jgi:hypothetical protein